MFNRSNELQVNGTRAEIRAYASELTRAMHDTCLSLFPELTRLGQHVSIVTHLMNFPTSCGYRIIELLESENNENVDQLAGIARSLFECWVTFEYLKEEKFIHLEKRVIEMISRDELDLIEASMSKMYPNTTIPPVAQATLDRLQALNPPKHLNVRALAKRANVEDEYLNYYKLFCKYVHPSLYFMIGDQRVVYSDIIVRLIAKRATMYLECFANQFVAFGNTVLQRPKP